ncbi:lectin beta-1 and beta-2 chains-like [Hevea brasiliensis]|uniref:lectin beta-1 and beta-2 chains-like n=1 Tax=Hevea brasiliensis TaxID=3981 RepID=UPI0025D2B100|nr:lectin beta-1 and beta-2 chains-like [Hevea brasiliensis]
MESSKRPSLCTFIILFLFTFFPFKIQSSTESTAFSFNEFSSYNMTEIKLEGDAYAEDPYIQLTKSFDQLSSNGSVGRATYYKPIHLWDKSGNIADFKTHFSFAMNSNGNESRGNGFAFFLANNGSKLEPLSGGGRLGLLSYTNAQLPFVAVEFDTGWTTDWDPADGNEHIGIDLNSLFSVVVTNWTQDDIANGEEIQAWIEYNSSSKNLSVLVTNGNEESSKGNNSYNLHYIVDFREYLTDEWVTVGFSASTTIDLFEEHEIHTWNFNSTLQVDENLGNHTNTQAAISSKRENKVWIWAVLGVSGTLNLVLLSLVWYGYCKNRRRKTENGPGSANRHFGETALRK